MLAYLCQERRRAALIFQQQSRLLGAAPCMSDGVQGGRGERWLMVCDESVLELIGVSVVNTELFML